MKVLNFDAERATISFSIEELDVLRNGLNEARLLLSRPNFDTRIGISVEDASTLIKALQALIGDIDDRSGRRYSEPPDDQRAKITG
ncbi:MAG: hypothetical protein M3P30_14675 [Chloroflexota bacterium]|nr:hypothetical protein [Chloroflexota bacterium]